MSYMFNLILEEAIALVNVSINDDLSSFLLKINVLILYIAHFITWSYQSILLRGVIKKLGQAWNGAI